MPQPCEAQKQLGAVDAIRFDESSRDEAPWLLHALQLYITPELQKAVFEILEQAIEENVRRSNGRPGMNFWRVLVLAHSASVSTAIMCDSGSWPIIMGCSDRCWVMALTMNTSVVPHEALFSGAPEGGICGKLIKDNQLDVVIGLPGICPRTVVPVAILIFDRSREKGDANENRKDVLFVAASQDYQPGKTQNALMDEHMAKILNAYEAREEVEKYVHLAIYDELKENDFNLNIPRYVDTFEEEVEIDIETVHPEMDTLEEKLTEVRDKMVNLLKEVAA